jgi:DNA-binding MurR/RpiR family transcriptional regulator
MELGPLADHIVTTLETMPTQLQIAARSALSRLQDVARLSTREQARRAGVQAATITRPAQRLGHDGDAPIRAFSAEAIRDEDLGFAATAGRQVARWKLKGARALPAERVGPLTKQMAWLSQPDATEQHVAAIARLIFARCVYCMGLQAWHAMAWPSYCVALLLGDRAPLPAATAGVGRASLCFARLKDLLFAVGVEPCTQITIKAADANKRGILIVGALSPLARLAAEVPTHSRFFFYPLTPMLAVIVPGLAGEVSLAALQRTEARRVAFHVRRSQESRAVRCPPLS